jgi:asparagine synthase (glutamine-hydrolysing)
MEHGAAALDGWNGMFAFFIWDALTERGFAAVDPLSIKPFFYHIERGLFAFASEAGALIESGAVPFAPNDEAIAESLVAPYFSGAVSLPFAGVKRLPPGHYLEVTRDGVTVTPYYRFDRQVSDTELPVADRVEQAVRACLRADAPVGVFLSGGVDSSLIAAIARKPAWTIAYDGEDDVDYSQSLIVKSADRPYAERVAASHGFRHTIVRVDAARYQQALPRTLRNNDLICAWEQEVSQDLLAAAASKEVKAVLVGDAADETHFGYSFLLNPARIASPRRIIEFFGMAPLRRSFLDDGAGYFACQYEKFAADRGHTWKTERAQRLAMSCLIYHLWLTRLMHNGDIQLMAHSLEGRVPFGDRGLLALAQQTSPELGYRGGIEKWHLRTAAERFLEPQIAWRPKSALTKNLLAHQIIHRHFASAWRKSSGLIERYVDCDAVERMAAGPAPQTESATAICFRLLATMSWFQRFTGAAA